MASLDLSRYSMSDLDKLQEEIDARRKSIKKEGRKEALKAAKAAAKKHGFDLGELVRVRKAGGTRKPAEPKYRNPAKPEVTWSGRGRKPTWIRDHLSKGKKLEELGIQAL